jgi:hypothetical protein
LEGRGEGFGEDVLAELHDRFFGTGRQLRLLNETCQRIETTMAQLLSQVGGMSRDATGYGDKLVSFGDALSRQPQSRELRALVGEILDATRTSEPGAATETQLGETSRQIEGSAHRPGERAREAAPTT